jgi:hypothetical protein
MLSSPPEEEVGNDDRKDKKNRHALQVPRRFIVIFMPKLRQ